MIMDPIWFEEGRLKTNAPTYLTQMVRVSDAMAAGFPGLVR
jgi:hypothetical protein